MSRTVYHYSRYSRLVAWLAAIVFVCTLGMLLYCIIFKNEALSLAGLFINFIGACSSAVLLATSRIDIDDESGIMTFHNLGKVTVDLRKVDRIARHVSARGKLRYATFHEVGVKYSDIAINAKNEVALMAHITRINPDIQIITYKV